MVTAVEFATELRSGPDIWTETNASERGAKRRAIADAEAISRLSRSDHTSGWSKSLSVGSREKNLRASQKDKNIPREKLRLIGRFAARIFLSPTLRALGWLDGETTGGLLRSRRILVLFVQGVSA